MVTPCTAVLVLGSPLANLKADLSVTTSTLLQFHSNEKYRALEGPNDPAPALQGRDAGPF